MGKVINMQDKLDEKLPHEVSEVICVKCATRWISVRPVGTLLKDLECITCREAGAVIETGQDLDVGESENV